MKNASDRINTGAEMLTKRVFLRFLAKLCR